MGTGGGVRAPGKSQRYRISKQYWTGSHEKSHSYNVGPSSAQQLNAISMAFCWWVYNSPLLVVLGLSLPLSTKQKNVRVEPPLTKLSGSAHAFSVMTVVVIAIPYTDYFNNYSKETLLKHK